MTTTVMFCPSSPAGGSAPGSYANTLAGSWVEDQAGNVYWLETATDLNGVVTYVYYDQPGGNVVTPTGDVSPVADSNMQIIKRGDDVNGDGSLVITFYRLNVYDVDGVILASILQNADGTTYTLQGDEIDPQDEIEEILKISNNTSSDILAQCVDANARAPGSFLNFNFDEVDLLYVSSGPATGEIESSTYKLAGAVVGVITTSYDPVTGDLINVVRS